MKKYIKYILVPILSGIILTLTGCVGPLYTKESQAPKGKGWGLFGSSAATQARIDRMAVDKIQNTPAQIGFMGPNGPIPVVASTNPNTNTIPAGYLGVIANLSTHRRLLFKYAGPETGIEYLGPGQQVEKYLLPGTYSGEIFYGGQRVGWATFKSEPIEKGFLGKKCHWYFFSEW